MMNNDLKIAKKTWYILRGVIQRTPTYTPRENVGWKLKRAIYEVFLSGEEMKGLLIVFVVNNECYSIECYAEIINETCED